MLGNQALRVDSKQLVIVKNDTTSCLVNSDYSWLLTSWYYQTIGSQLVRINYDQLVRVTRKQLVKQWIHDHGRKPSLSIPDHRIPWSY